MTILPAGCPSTAMSKNTLGLAIAVLSSDHEERANEIGYRYDARDG